MFKNGVLTGTTGAEFVVAKIMAAGVVGYRELGNADYRVRVEAKANAAGERLTNPGGGFTQSGSQTQPAFSAVVSAASVPSFVVLGAKALKAAETIPLSTYVATALAASGF